MQIISLFFLFFAAKVAVFLLKNKGCLVIFAFFRGIFEGFASALVAE